MVYVPDPCKLNGRYKNLAFKQRSKKIIANTPHPQPYPFCGRFGLKQNGIAVHPISCNAGTFHSGLMGAAQIFASIVWAVRAQLTATASVRRDTNRRNFEMHPEGKNGLLSLKFADCLNIGFKQQMRAILVCSSVSLPVKTQSHPDRGTGNR